MTTKHRLGQGRKEYRCQKCGRKFFSYSWLILHHKNAHEKQLELKNVQRLEWTRSTKGVLK